MVEKFEVGEIAIFSRPNSIFFGIEVSITLPLHNSLTKDRLDGSIRREDVYGIYAPELGLPPSQIGWVARPKDLRKRRPPQDWVKLCNLTDIPRARFTAEAGIIGRIFNV